MCHVCREKKHSPFIWNMSLVVLFTNYFRNMGPSKSLLFKIIPGKLSLVFAIFMGEIQCIGNLVNGYSKIYIYNMNCMHLDSFLKYFCSFFTQGYQGG